MELQQTLEIQFEEPKEKKNMELKKQDTKDYALLQRCIALIEQARMYVAQNVNTAMVTTYYEIGRYIVEDEQQGQQRAQYGKQVLKELSSRLTEQFGKGWSVETLKKCRTFFNTYSVEIGSTTQTESNLVHSVDQIQLPRLSWNHLQKRCVS